MSDTDADNSGFQTPADVAMAKVEVKTLVLEEDKTTSPAASFGFGSNATQLPPPIFGFGTKQEDKAKMLIPPSSWGGFGQPASLPFGVKKDDETKKLEPPTSFGFGARGFGSFGKKQEDETKMSAQPVKVTISGDCVELEFSGEKITISGNKKSIAIIHEGEADLAITSKSAYEERAKVLTMQQQKKRPY